MREVTSCVSFLNHKIVHVNANLMEMRSRVYIWWNRKVETMPGTRELKAITQVNDKEAFESFWGKAQGELESLVTVQFLWLTGFRDEGGT